MRHRQLPNDPVMTTATKVMVVDPSGYVGWRPYAGVGTDCDWDPALGNIATAWRASGTNGTCPEEDNTVGIGTDNAAAKLHVATDEFGSSFRIDNTTNGGNLGADVNVTGAAGTSLGVDVLLTGSSFYNVGVVSTVNTTNSGGFSTAGGGTFVSESAEAYSAWGVDAIARGGLAQSYGTIGRAVGSATINVGAVGHSLAGSTFFAAPGLGARVGVFGSASGDDGNINRYAFYGRVGGPELNSSSQISRWAGYFDGNVYSPYGVWTSSDAQLKSNIQDLSPDLAREKLNALVAKTYVFNAAAYPDMGFGDQPQIGFDAEQVESVLPELVSSVTRPGFVVDGSEETTASYEHKIMNYQGIIPVLVAGYQAQSAQMQGMEDRLAETAATLAEAMATIDELRGVVQEQSRSLDACCDRMQERGTGTSGLVGNEEGLDIIPNPVANRTLLRYHVAQPGRARLEVTTSEGRLLEVLREERAMAGDHTYDWNTTGLSAGTYFVALVLDGQVIVKRAVKVGE